eukprot:c773_g1_i1 orf=87-269(+)
MLRSPTSWSPCDDVFIAQVSFLKCVAKVLHHLHIPQRGKDLKPLSLFKVALTNHSTNRSW